MKNKEILDYLNKAIHMDRTPNGIPFQSWITGPQGAHFSFYPVKGTHTGKEVKKAGSQLRNERDVVSLETSWLIPKFQDTYWLAEKESQLFVWLPDSSYKTVLELYKLIQKIKDTFSDKPVNIALGNPGDFLLPVISDKVDPKPTLTIPERVLLC